MRGVSIIDKRTKFNISKDKEKRTYNNIVFDSILEMKYYRDVILPLVESNDITYLELQKPYELQPKFTHDNKSVQSIKYVADFYVRFSDGREEVIDTKGCPDSVAKIKRKMFWYHYPNIIYRWVSYSKIDGGWCDYDYIKKRRLERSKHKQ